MIFLNCLLLNYIKIFCSFRLIPLNLTDFVTFIIQFKVRSIVLYILKLLETFLYIRFITRNIFVFNPIIQFNLPPSSCLLLLKKGTKKKNFFPILNTPLHATQKPRTRGGEAERPVLVGSSYLVSVQYCSVNALLKLGNCILPATLFILCPFS